MVGVVGWIDGGGCLFANQGGGVELTFEVVQGSLQVRWVGCGGPGAGGEVPNLKMISSVVATS